MWLGLITSICRVGTEVPFGLGPGFWGDMASSSYDLWLRASELKGLMAHRVLGFRGRCLGGSCQQRCENAPDVLGGSWRLRKYVIHDTTWFIGVVSILTTPLQPSK